ncbi:MAG: right-handed parallel beta-helix repeat-containing protein [Actinobacteria bacterium]|nr:MAG: right-handed parallel beta-helix repeat-containing protein [Actinomycetota bacterium]
MRGRTFVLTLVALAFLGVGSSAGGAVRDDTDALQAKLDAGGAVFLPKLPGGQCYATRGLWLSRDDTTITSDGGCIVALGFGPARLDPTAPKPHFANAVFYITHSTIRAPVPARISISGLRISVPRAKRMYGVSVGGHEVSLSGLTIDGAPLNDVLIGSGAVGAGSPIIRVSLTDSTLRGAQRDAVLAYGPVGLRVEGNTVTRAGGTGIHIKAADRGQPVLDTHVVRNTIADARGSGVFVDLAPPNGVVLLAKGIEVAGNRILRNAGGGIVIAGKGEVALSGNVLAGNRGRAVLRRAGRAQRRPAMQRSVAPASTGDDTAWLQARLDRGGGTIFLPKLPGGACYATRGLWVSHDHTTITSDGACIVALGLGPIRLRSTDGDPIASDAVFFVNRSGPKQPAPVDVTISNLRIVVPAGLPAMYGVAVFGHDVTLSHLDIAGVPKDDVTISGRANGNSYSGDISVLDSTLGGAARNAISVTGAIGLRIERNTIEGVRDAPPGQPAAGIDVEPDTRDRPASDLHIVGNTIQDNAGPGILLELEPNEGPDVLATDLEIAGNTIVRNALQRSPPKRAGIVLAGGQDGGAGTLLLKDNIIRENGGPGILETHFQLRVDASGNDVSNNDA